jgi:hypothetical protein
LVRQPHASTKETTEMTLTSIRPGIRPGIRRALAVGLACVAGLGAAAAAIAPQQARAAASASVVEFPQEVRHLNGFWANENVPAYRCPASHPYLENRNYAPFGTSLIPGVSIVQERDPWPIGVSITLATPASDTGEMYPPAVGIKGGAGNASATNWTFGSASYQVVLHCTADPALGYKVDRSGAIVL